MDVFYALSHGVHRGVLRPGKEDERETFISKLQNSTLSIIHTQLSPVIDPNS